MHQLSLSNPAALKPRRGLTSALAALLLSAPLSAPVQAQAPLEGLPEKLGTVDFPVTCSSDAQKHMTRGVALYYSYHWPEARKSFNAVSQADPSCAMAHWGHALIAMNNPFIWPLTGKALQEGMASIEKANSLGVRTAGERAKARLHYTAVSKLLDKADPGRPERDLANAFLAR